MSGPLDRRSDVFSLGLVMFECLTGHQVFEGCTPAQIQYKMIQGRMPRISDFVRDVDPQLDQICSTALSFQASGRYSTAYVMARELRSYLTRVGAHTGRELVAELMRERFGVRAKKRLELVARMATDQCSDEEIRTILGARAVMAIDLFNFPPLSAAPVTLEPEDQGHIDEDSFDDDATILEQSTQESTTEGPTIDEDLARPPPTLDETAPPSSPVLADPPPIPEPSQEGPVPQFPPPVLRFDSFGARMKPLASLPLVPDDAPSEVSDEEFVDQTRLLADDEDIEAEESYPPFDTHPLMEEDAESRPRPPEDTKKVAPDTKPPEDTKKVDPRALTPTRSKGISHGTALAIWFFGFGVGLMVGVVATLLLR